MNLERPPIPNSNHLESELEFRHDPNKTEGIDFHGNPEEISRKMLTDFDGRTDSAITASNNRLESIVRNFGGNSEDLRRGSESISPTQTIILNLRKSLRAAVYGLGGLAAMEASGTSAQSPAESPMVVQISAEAPETETIRMPNSHVIRPPIAKDNPQRQAYAGDYAAYQKYVESMRDPMAEKINADRQKELWQNFQRCLKLSMDESLSENNRNDYFSLARAWYDLLDKTRKKDPKKIYEEARNVSQGEYAQGVVNFPAAFKSADDQRDWLADIVYSGEYERRALAEGLSPEEIEKRRSVATGTDVNMADMFDQTDPGNIGAYSKLGNPWDYGRVKPGGYVVSREEQAAGIPVALHELEHAITDGNAGLSKYAEDLYRNAYIGEGSSRETNEYLSRFTELDARRRVFQYDLEKNGIWRYGEVFTPEHLKRAFELKKEGKLSGDSIVFLDVIRGDKIPEIMNTIASNINRDTNHNENKPQTG